MSKSSIMTKIGLCVLLVIIADGLFYRQPIGWTLGLYAGLLLLTLVALNRQTLASMTSKIIAFCTATLIIELIEQPEFLTVSLVGLGLITLLILQKRKKLDCALLWLKDVSRFFSQGKKQWHRDLDKLHRVKKRKGGHKIQFSYAVIPVLLTLAFVFLFARANPIIDQALEMELLLKLISVWRWLFWFITAITVWALLRPHFIPNTVLIPNSCTDLDRWFNQQTIVLSLVMFNGIFALQNVLDIVFLWSGETLPNGLNYAEYAHSGAYPLFFTSFISAIYVFITFNEYQPHYQTAWSKKLVFVWLAQNVFLLISAINRLLQYIEAYSLTYLRIVALLGMALTAVGIALIFARIYSNRSNRWLINSNALAIAATLYIACFVNMDSFIANYNVRHSLEVTGMGTSVDLSYLFSLGTESLPALRWFQANAKYNLTQDHGSVVFIYVLGYSGDLITRLENELSSSTENWRAWTWRKQRQLAIKSAPAQAIPIGDSGWQY